MSFHATVVWRNIHRLAIWFGVCAVLAAGSTVSLAKQHAPSALTATAISSSQIELSWTDNTPREVEFRIDRSLKVTGGFDEIARVDAGSTSFRDAGLAPAATYYYRVRAHANKKRSSWSNIASATTMIESLTETALTVELSAPGNGSVVSGTFTLSATASDSVVEVDFYRDEVLIASDRSAPFASELNSVDWPNGPHNFLAVGYDAANNQSRSTPIILTCNNPPPSAPSEVTAVALSSSQVNLSWRDNSRNHNGFRLERSADPSFSAPTQIAFASDVTAHTESGLSPNTPYFYRVKASSANWGDSEFSPPVAVTTLGAGPSEPGSLSATTLATGEVTLRWADTSDNEAGFRVQRASSPTGPWSDIATLGANETSFTNAGLVLGGLYYYRVCSFNPSGDSGFSNVSIATAEAGPPALLSPVAPGNFLATAGSPSQIELSWSDSSDNETGFKIEMAASIAGPWTAIAAVGAGTTSFSHQDLLANTSYAYRVRATNEAGDSDYSDIVSASTGRNVVHTTAAKGIYMLDNRHGTFRLSSLQYANKPWIDGWAWRMSWTAFDTGTTDPKYDFSAVTTAITQLQAMNKKLSLMLNVQEVPTYALRDADDTYNTKVPYWEYSTTTSVSWDAPTLNHYRNFLHALAGFRVYDSSQGRIVPLREHPTLGPIRAGVIGRAHVARDQFGDLLHMPGYTRDGYLRATRDCLTAIQDEFPSNLIHVGFFDIKDNVRSPALDSALLDMIFNAFNGTTRPHIGLFEELLTGDKPISDGSYGQNLLRAMASGCPILFQALGSWRDHDPGDWTHGDDSPANGLGHAYDIFGTRYFEMYMADLYHEPFRPVFEEWQQFLAGLPD